MKNFGSQNLELANQKLSMLETPLPEQNDYKSR